MTLNPSGTESRDSNPEDYPRPLIEHLEELRLRIIYAVLFLLAGTIIGFVITQQYLFKILVSPLLTIPNAKLLMLGPADKLIVCLKIGFLTGVALALPLILHQLWLFLRPALTPNEKRYLLVVLFSSVILFFLGTSFVFFIMTPAALRFLLTMNLDISVEPTIAIDKYFSFLLGLMLAGGLVFQIPLISWFLAKLGILTSRGMSKARRFAILGAAILSAALTPTGDPINFTLLAVPIYALYELSILIVHFSQRKPSASPLK